MCADDSHFAFLKRKCREIEITLVLLAQNAKILRRGFLLRKSRLCHFQYFALQNPAPTRMRHTVAATNVQAKDR